MRRVKPAALLLLLLVPAAPAACGGPANDQSTQFTQAWCESCPAPNLPCGPGGTCACYTTQTYCGECTTATGTAACAYCPHGQVCGPDPCHPTCLPLPANSCPSDFPVDCGNGSCCPSSMPACCPGGGYCAIDMGTCTNAGVGEAGSPYSGSSSGGITGSSSGSSSGGSSGSSSGGTTGSSDDYTVAYELWANLTVRENGASWYRVGSVSGSGTCASGSYYVSGTVSETSGSTYYVYDNLTYTFSSCQFVDGSDDLVFSGSVHRNATWTFRTGVSTSDAGQGTMSSSNLTVTGTVGSTSISGYVGCALSGNASEMSVAPTSYSESGTICGRSY